MAHKYPSELEYLVLGTDEDLPYPRNHFEEISYAPWNSIYKGPLVNCEITALKEVHMFGGGYGPPPKAYWRGMAFQALSNHPCVLPVIGFYARDPPSFVTKFVPDGSLQDLLIKLVEGEKPEWWTKTHLACCLYGVATALRDAHELGVIHGDVKPSDILFDLDAHEALLGDFGLYKGYWRTYCHKLGPKEPRFPWIGPYGSTAKDCDVCSFGMTAYLMTAGVENLPDGHLARRLADGSHGCDDRLFGRIYTHPFEDTFERTPAIDNAWWDLITKCCDWDSGKRPSFEEICTWITDKPYYYAMAEDDHSQEEFGKYVGDLNNRIKETKRAHGETLASVLRLVEDWKPEGKDYELE